MSQDPEWRQFELLAARIERTLVPQGAVVRSPDRIQDLVTGSLREVDASIRFVVGSTPILITIECRRRDAVQDDTWIEQLATKREKVGAAKTIAVSSSGFSEPAKLTAGHKGIELRTLREVTDEEIVAWLRSVVFTRVGLHTKLIAMSAEVDHAGPPENHRIVPEPQTGTIRALIRVADGKFVSPYHVMKLVIQSDPGLFVGIALDGSKEKRVVTANLPVGSFHAQTSAGAKPIKSISFELECWHQVKSGILTQGFHFEYADQTGTLLRGAEFKTDVGDAPVILGITVVPRPKPGV